MRLLFVFLLVIICACSRQSPPSSADAGICMYSLPSCDCQGPPPGPPGPGWPGPAAATCAPWDPSCRYCRIRCSGCGYDACGYSGGDQAAFAHCVTDPDNGPFEADGGYALSAFMLPDGGPHILPFGGTSKWRVTGFYTGCPPVAQMEFQLCGSFDASSVYCDAEAGCSEGPKLCVDGRDWGCDPGSACLEVGGTNSQCGPRAGTVDAGLIPDGGCGPVNDADPRTSRLDGCVVPFADGGVYLEDGGLNLSITSGPTPFYGVIGFRVDCPWQLGIEPRNCADHYANAQCFNVPGAGSMCCSSFDGGSCDKISILDGGGGEP